MAVWLASLLWGCCLCPRSAETANCLAHLAFMWVPGISSIVLTFVQHTLYELSTADAREHKGGNSHL